MISKIEIPNTYTWDGSDTTLIDSEDWIELVSQIEAVNEEIEQMTKVYMPSDKENFKSSYPEYTISTEKYNNRFYSYITKPQPIPVSKTKEERAIQLVEQVLNNFDPDYFDTDNKAMAFYREAQEILEESEET